MAEWRFARGWTAEELRERRTALHGRERNFTQPNNLAEEPVEWRRHRSRARIAVAAPGPPEEGGPFRRARSALDVYAFSDPGIVEAHFEPDAPLQDRRMLLELKVPLLRYLAGVVVTRVRDEVTSAGTTFGFRYDTLEEHIERGWEWFVLHKDHESGVITFHVSAIWLPGDFPNWWSRLGFTLVGRSYQRRWHRRAHHRMAAFADGAPLAESGSSLRLPRARPKMLFEHGRAAEGDLEPDSAVITEFLSD